MTRLGFLGNRAVFAADANLIAQIVALSFLLAGLYFVRSGRLKTHAHLMKSAIVFQFAALIVWMGPSLILNFGAFRTLGSGPLIAAAHALFGGLALVLAISAAFHRSLVSSQLRWTMWAAFLVWSVGAIFGIAFYLYYYVL